MEYGCKVCKRTRNSRKMKPYGAQPGKFWCSKCDADMVSSVNKTKTRQAVKRAIKKAQDEE